MGPHTSEDVTHKMEGSTPQKRGQLGSRYILTVYIYILEYYIPAMYIYLHQAWLKFTWILVVNAQALKRTSIEFYKHTNKKNTTNNKPTSQLPTVSNNDKQ